jgi:short-subunit dehydrogenase
VSDQRVVAITGASSGIGRATAHELSRRGGALILISRDAAALAVVVEECEALGGRAFAAPADVNDEDALRDAACRAIDALGRLDAWINCAAVVAYGRFEETPSAVFRRVIETNVLGYANGARIALNEFRRRGRGVLVNIASGFAAAPEPYASSYVASKYAVRGFSGSLRMELAIDQLHDVHVCTVMPSAVDTPLFEHAANYSGRAVRALRPTYPPENVAKTIASLLDHPRAEVVIGGSARAAIAQARFARPVYERFGARYLDAAQFENAPSSSTEGNLFRTMGRKAVSGGWGTSSLRRRRIAAAAMGGLFAFFALRKLRR